MRGLILVNPRSGDGSDDDGGLSALFSDHEVVRCSPEEMPDKAKDAVAKRVDFVAVAGGDGTVRCVTEILAEGHVPLLPVPAGTRNHFAREVGIATLEDAAEAAAHGSRRAVDLGEVNDCRFVNNSSVGVYPAIVVTREAHQRRWPKQLANLLAIWEQLRHGHRFWVRVNGRKYRAWMVFVGNGTYGKGLWNLADRKALDDNLLDFRLVRADLPLARCRVVFALLTGRLDRSPLLVHEQHRELEIDLDRDTIDVALDGEVERLKPPLRYRSLPGALEVLVPASEASGPSTASRRGSAKTAPR